MMIYFARSMVYGLWSIGTRTVVCYAVRCCVYAAMKEEKALKTLLKNKEENK